MAEHRAFTEQQQEQETAPKLCKNMCGFYGNPANLDMCSKCFKEYVTEQQKTQAPPAVTAPELAAAVAPVAEPEPEPKQQQFDEQEQQQQPAVKPPAASEAVEAPERPAAAAVEEPTIKDGGSPERPVQANRSRCFCCNKKVGLLGFECRCGYVYCSTHRHASEHSCTFDYKTMDREKLAKANPTVAAARVNKF
ncbi:hypothetical protein N2152v2_005746 [Parachlorella kessleri]